MEDNRISMVHKMTITNRKSGSYTGIVDVISFDMNEVLLETQMGMLHIKGKDLHVNRLNLDKGEVDVDGEIQSLVYEDIKHLKNQGKISTIGLGKLNRHRN